MWSLGGHSLGQEGQLWQCMVGVNKEGMGGGGGGLMGHTIQVSIKCVGGGGGAYG